MNNICGVDISKKVLDVCIFPSGVCGQFPRTTEGIGALAAFCREYGADMVVMEATGGLERLVLALLGEAGVACALANPARVRAFARAMGALEKTDKIDAQMIARYALSARLVPIIPQTENERQLKALVVRLRQVTDDLTIQKQRLSSITDQASIVSIQEVVALLKRQSRELESQIAALIDDDPLWSRLNVAFREVKGVAGRTVARLMADLPEIGHYSNKAIAKLTGLAPIADESGGRKGNRAISGGRACVRSILYLVAAIAAKYDQRLQEFKQRLQKAGKPKMVIRIALAHKLIVWLNAKARETRANMAMAD